ncbi:hypothetical protein B0H14DRAFT_2605969 [Mycena olivaceomarginata]|nr:hypothetical protein B0H14DRAFT_2605969 [Mycena olivaceomarginata]
MVTVGHFSLSILGGCGRMQIKQDVAAGILQLVFTGGIGTWFTQNNTAGACGTVHKDTDFVVALQTDIYDNGAHCGRFVTVAANGNVHTALVADECPTCANTNSVDMSEEMFQQSADLSVGVLNISPMHPGAG